MWRSYSFLSLLYSRLRMQFSGTCPGLEMFLCWIGWPYVRNVFTCVGTETLLLNFLGKKVKHLISYKEPTRCSHVVEFIIPVFLNCSTCFGRHTAHQQELKNYNFSLWFYVRFWLPVAVVADPSQRPATKNVCKTRSCNYSFWAPNDGRCVTRDMLSN